MKKLLTFVLFSFSGTLSLELVAQSRTAGWLAAFNTFKTGKGTSLHFDAQVRSSDKFEHLQTILLRPGFNYQFRKNMTATLGYALIENRRSMGPATGYIAEHRIWQQLVISHPVKHATLAHRFRLEQRWIGTPVVRDNNIKTGDYFTAQRIRYFLRSVIPFKHSPSFEKGMFGAVQNEVFGNLGNKDQLNGRFFDQNRLYLAVGYRLNKKTDLEAGYMNQYAKGRDRNFVNTHIAQLALYTRL